MLTITGSEIDVLPTKNSLFSFIFCMQLSSLAAVHGSLLQHHLFTVMGRIANLGNSVILSYKLL